MPSSDEGSLPRHSGPAWEARRCRRELRDHEQTLSLLGDTATNLRGHPSHSVHICGWSDVEDRRSTGSDERKAPFRRNRRGSQSSRDRDPVHVDRLLFGSPADDRTFGISRHAPTRKRHFRRCDSSSTTTRSGWADRERDARCAAARPDIDDGPGEALRLLHVAYQAPIDQHAVDLGSVTDRRQARRPSSSSSQRSSRDQSTAEAAGVTTMWRYGSSPSLCVSMPSMSFRCRCTILRSTELIGSRRIVRRSGAPARPSGRRARRAAPRGGRGIRPRRP